jgi:hypothetical protein
LYRFDNARIGAATAQVRIHVLNNLSPARFGIFLQNTVGFQNHAGSTEAALDSPMLHKSFLQWMKLLIGCQALDSKNLFSCGILDRVLTGSNRFFIDDYGAGSALAVATAKFRAGQLKIRSQHPKEGSISISGHAYRTSIKLETNGLRHEPFPFNSKRVYRASIRLSQSNKEGYEFHPSRRIQGTLRCGFGHRGRKTMKQLNDTYVIYLILYDIYV